MDAMGLKIPEISTKAWDMFVSEGVVRTPGINQKQKIEPLIIAPKNSKVVQKWRHFEDPYIHPCRNTGSFTPPLEGPMIIFQMKSPFLEGTRNRAIVSEPRKKKHIRYF